MEESGVFAVLLPQGGANAVKKMKSCTGGHKVLR